MRDIINNIFIINAPVELCERWEGLEASTLDDSAIGITDPKFSVIPFTYTAAFPISMPEGTFDIEALECLLEYLASSSIYNETAYPYYNNAVILYNIKNRTERRILEELCRFKLYKIANLKFHLLLDNPDYLTIDSFMESYLNELQSNVNCRKDYALTGWAIDKLKSDWKTICSYVYSEEASA